MNLFIKQQGQGKPLVLLHGWGFNSEIWNSLVPQLTPHWHVYQVDLPGHGRSAVCEYTLPVLTEIFATQLPPQAVWIGWSLGGLIAMAMARWRPAWVHALVLVTSSTHPIMDSSFRWNDDGGRSNVRTIPITPTSG